MMLEFKWHNIKDLPFAVFPYGEFAFLLQWEEKIDMAINEEIIALQEHLAENEHILEMVPAYASLLILYKRRITNIELLIQEIYQEYRGMKKKSQPNQSLTLHRIPVCYDLIFSEDLDLLMKEKQLSLEEVIHIHTQPIYHVYMMGFLPGFMYMGGLDPRLEMERKTTPRQRVEKGAVGIAGLQAGIYPMECPGGWNVIGRTPLPLFFPDKNPPVLVEAGDKVKFYKIDKDEYFKIKEKILNDQLEYEKFKEKWQP